MHARWTLTALALALAACSSTRSSGPDQTAVNAEPADKQQASTSPADQAAASGAPGDALSGDRIEGRVAFVDAGNHEIAIDAGSATTQVRVADDAKITIDGKQSSFDDLKPGANVRVSLDKSGDVPQATVIEVRPAEK
jgi:hypothetical protein